MSDEIVKRKQHGGYSGLTPEVEERLVALLASGCTIKDAAYAEGFDKTTVYTWLRRGRGGEQPYASFLEKVNAASHRNKIARLTRITNAAMNDWKADAWFLSRRYPEEFADRTKLEHSVGKSSSTKEAVKMARELLNNETARHHIEQASRALYGSMESNTGDVRAAPEPGQVEE